MKENMLFSGESKNIEYKVTVPDKSEKYMKTVVAFANGKGGKIVFGVDDKTLEIVGMNTENIYKTMDAITNAISDACEPAIRPDVALQTVKDKTVIVVEILPGAQRPYYIKSQGMIDGTYVRVSGTTRHVEGRREFEGPIQEQMEAAYRYVLEKINMGMTIKGMYRQDVYELPTDSIREIIANAVAHRSYLEQGSIQVALFDDRLEVTSPGMLLNNVTISKMMVGYSKPRNPAIARAFAYMKIIEKWGTGIPRLFEACAEYGLPEPELIDFDGDFRVNMYRKRDTDIKTNTKKVTNTNIKTNTEKVTNTNTKTNTNIKKQKANAETATRILEIMREQPTITVKKIADQMRLSVAGVRYHINKMKKDGLVEHVGPSKKGTWLLHDES